MTPAAFSGHYDGKLVIVSVVIAICASYCAIDLAGRITASKGNRKLIWLSCGALSMGLGIWAMHYIGMLALNLPVPVLYDIPTVGFSLVAAVVSSAVALSVVSGERLQGSHWVAGSLAMGAGISTMHYAGMWAMRLPAHCDYNPWLVSASILIAFGVSMAALRIAFRLREASGRKLPFRIASATLMGTAIAAMHYTGMAAVCFRHQGGVAMQSNYAVNVTQLGVAGIVLVTFLALGFAIGASIVDRYLAVEKKLLLLSAYDTLEDLVKQRTAELEKSESRWRGLIEALPQFVWSTRADGYCEYLSSQWIDYTGVPMDEQVGSGWLQALHPTDQARTYAVWQHATSARAKYDVEYRIRAKDGSFRWFQARGVPVLDHEGIIESWIGTSTDIDSQKRSEERLEAAVAERTGQLAVALERAEQAAQSKSAFMASMSHEIRTPMNGVMGMTGLMLATKLTSEQRVFMDAIRSSGEALLSVINDVLDFSKIEAGKMQLEETEFDLQTLVEETVEIFQHTALDKKLKLQFSIDRTVPLDLLGDSGRLRQILLNLLANAVKFTERGSVTLTVTPDAGGMKERLASICFSVSDTGIGMTEEQQQSLFQAFVQGDRSTTRKFGGSGLGLTIAKRLTQLMGGSIQVTSRFGCGSKFSFRVCLRRPVGVESYAVLRNKLMLPFGSGELLRDFQKQYLEQCGLRVQGGEHIRPDILLVDSAHAEGLEKLREQARSARFANVPILVLGSCEDESAALLFAEFEVAGFVPKPVRRRQMLGIIADILNGKNPAICLVDPSSSRAAKGTRILVAEDNEVNQMVICGLLEMSDYHVEVVENGRDACQALLRESYDLVLMDCQMPVMDGFEATREIRRVELSGRRMPIIALSASVLKEDRDFCLDSGMDDFLAKPVSKAALEKALNTWLPGGKQPEPIASEMNA